MPNSAALWLLPAHANSWSQRAHLALITFSLPLLLVVSNAACADQNEDLFNANFSGKTIRVNEGSLAFLATPPTKKTHIHSNQVTISHTSLVDSWVTNRQCHENIDAIDNVQITYNSAMTRQVTILSSRHIGKAWVEAGNVELRNIKADAEICVQYDARALHFEEEGQVRLRTGPYMRQFFDGFYPMNVKLDVSYPCEDLHFIHSNYTNRPGYELAVADCTVRIDAWFEGKLISELMFVRKTRKRSSGL